MTLAKTEQRDILQQYLNAIQGHETLSFEEEQELAREWKNNNNRQAADRLAFSHLRLVVKIAISFKGYKLPLDEIIQEGNIGLMNAIERFDPDKGFRLSTYAVWWIRASIQEYVLTSFSLVKIGTTAAQKKLFFNLRKMRNQLQNMSEEHITAETIKSIAKALDVTEEDVLNMNQRMLGADKSLNSLVGEDDSSGELLDFLVDDSETQEELYSKKEAKQERQKVLYEALEKLDSREREIITSRKLRESKEALTLEDLSQKFGISRERVRQLEVRAFNKIQKFICSNNFITA